MDLRCHGDSPTITDSISMENIADDVYNTLSAYNIHIDVLVGHSFGGKVALEMLRHTQQDLPQTVLILDIS